MTLSWGRIGELKPRMPRSRTRVGWWVSGVNYLDRSATIILAGVMGFDSAISSG